MADVSLRPVGRSDVLDVIGLQLADEQKGFVAPNAVSLAQAHYETGCYPMVIAADNGLVGFCSVIDHTEHAYLDDDDDPSAAFVWRFMIDRRAQGNGFGSAARDRLANWARDRCLTSLVLTVRRENGAALAFFLGRGFERPGRTWDGEVELARTISPSDGFGPQTDRSNP